MRSNGRSIVTGYSIFANEKCANIDYKYGPYANTTEAFEQLGPDGDDVLAQGLTIGVLEDGKIVEYQIVGSTPATGYSADSFVKKNSGGGTTYTEGTGIDISDNNVISVDLADDSFIAELARAIEEASASSVDIEDYISVGLTANDTAGTTYLVMETTNNVSADTSVGVVTSYTVNGESTLASKELVISSGSNKVTYEITGTPTAIEVTGIEGLSYMVEFNADGIVTINQPTTIVS